MLCYNVQKSTCSKILYLDIHIQSIYFAMVDMVDMARWHRAPNAMQIWKHCFISEDRREYITADVAVIVS